MKKRREFDKKIKIKNILFHRFEPAAVKSVHLPAYGLTD